MASKLLPLGCCLLGSDFFIICLYFFDILLYFSSFFFQVMRAGCLNNKHSCFFFYLERFVSAYFFLNRSYFIEGQQLPCYDTLINLSLSQNVKQENNMNAFVFFLDR